MRSRKEVNQFCQNEAQLRLEPQDSNSKSYSFFKYKYTVLSPTRINNGGVKSSCIKSARHLYFCWLLVNMVLLWFLTLLKVKTHGTDCSVTPLMVRDLRKSSCRGKNSISHRHPCFAIESKYVLELHISLLLSISTAFSSSTDKIKTHD